jgi:hypothetical protein
MSQIELNENHVKKLKELIEHLFPEEEEWVTLNFYTHFGYVVGIYNDSKRTAKNVGWLETCLYHILPVVAEHHGKQPFTTPNWSLHMVKQKIINDLPNINPIDTLYDIWKNPEKYSQDL